MDGGHVHHRHHRHRSDEEAQEVSIHDFIVILILVAILWVVLGRR